MYDEIINDFDKYCNNFKIILFQLKENSCIYASFPFCKIDGYTCFKFHKSLIITTKTGKDNFMNKDIIEKLNINVINNVKFKSGDKNIKPPNVNEIYYHKINSDIIYNITYKYHIQKKSDKIIELKNYLYDESIYFGNYLIYPYINTTINDKYINIKEEIKKKYEKDLETNNFNNDLKNIFSNSFVINNYGKNNFDDMIRYKWCIPILLKNSISGATFCITLNNQNYFAEF
jgi:hypothetical protein